MDGRLADAASGAGLEGEVTDLAGGLAVRTSPGTGLFSFHLDAGRHTLRARAFGYLDDASSVLQLAQGESRAIEVRLQRAARGVLEGRVVEAAGQPVAAQVRLPGTPLPAAACGSDGRFRLELPAGSYSVRVTAAGYAEETREPATVATAQTVRCDFRLARLPPILVVGDDGGLGRERHVARALDGLGRKYVVKARLPGTAIGAAELAQYHVVIWATGPRADRPDADHRQALASFLGVGGRLFLTGQNAATGLAQRDVEFLRRTLGADCGAGSVAADAVAACGSPRAFQLKGGSGSNDQTSPDALRIHGTGRGLLRYAPGGEMAALAAPSGKGKVVLFGFGLEGIDADENREAALGLVMAELGDALADRAARAVELRAAAAREPSLEPALESCSGALAEELLEGAAPPGPPPSSTLLPRAVRRALSAPLPE